MNKKSVEVRRYTFIVSVFLVLVIYIVMDWANYYHDVNNPLIVYGIELFFIGICAFFYTWWRFHQHRASSIFNWMTALFYFMFLETAMEFYARYLYIYDRLEYSSYIMSFVWTFRSIPKIIALIYMTSLVIGRIIGSRESNTIYYE